MTNFKNTYNQNIALVIVDVQNDFCPGGNLAVNNGDQVIPIINKLRENFKTVILTQDFHPENHSSFAATYNKAPFTTIELDYGTQVLWPEHCVQGTNGAEFCDNLVQKETDLLIKKGTNLKIDSYSAFFENDGITKPRFDDGNTFSEKLKTIGIDTLVFSGLAGDYCVAWNALDARKEGFKAIFIEDATRSIDDDNLITKKQDMINAGVEITTLQKLPALLRNRKNQPNI